MSIIMAWSNTVISQNLKSADNSFVFENISIREGLSNLQVTSICQDRLGYIWVGTARGLNRYDGVNMDHFFFYPDDKNQLLHDDIQALHPTSNGIVIMTLKGLNFYDLYTETLRQIPDSNYVFSTASVWKNNFYTIREGNRLFCLDTKKLQLELVKQFHDSIKIDQLYSDSLNGIWCVQSGRKGLVFYNPADGSVKHHSIYKNMQSVDISDILDIKQIGDILWIGTLKGLILYDIQQKRIINKTKYRKLLYILKDRNIQFFIQNKDEIWIGTWDKGIYIYHTQNNTLKNIVADEYTKLETNSLTAACVDRNNNIWLGTFNEGLNVLYNKRKRFNPNKYLNASTKDEFINCITSDGAGFFYFGSRYQGLIKADAKKTNTTYYTTSNSNLKNNHITSSLIDSRGILWLGQTGVVQTFNPETEHFKTLEIPANYGEMMSMTEFNGKIYICSRPSILVYNINGELLDELKVAGYHTQQIAPLNKRELLICTYEKGIFVYEPETKQVREIIPGSPPQAWLEKEFITIYIDSDSILWIGNFRWGLFSFDLKTKKLSIFNNSNGLPSNDVVGIEEDNEGNLWLSTSYGLSCFDKKKTFINYFYDEGVNNQQFHQKSVYKQSDGTLFFGGNKGITHFRPHEILSTDNSTPRTILRSLNINYEPVLAGDKHEVLEQSLPYTSSIVLSHKQSSFSIDYMAFNFDVVNKVKYSYLLEGFNKDWQNVDKSTRAVFSNLNPGNYTFKVRARDESSNWSNTATLNIKVKQAPWLTIWAIMFYIAFVLTIIILAFWLTLKYKLYQKGLEVEQNERQREKEVNQMKLRFFTNISHELRTPLTVISAMVYLIYKQFTPSGKSKELFDSLSLNVERLLKLINQLLLFREMETDAIKLLLREMTIKDVLQQTYQEFSHFAEIKKVNLRINDFSAIESTRFLFDRDKVEKILSNLISNALKHTQENDNITITVNKLAKIDAIESYQDLINYDFPVSAAGYMQISITDTGYGIDEKDLNTIFGRFRKTDKDFQKLDYLGSGIGLNFTKRLVNIHKGDIIVKSKPNEGATFSFILPLDKDIYSDEIIVDDQADILVPLVEQEKNILENKADIEDGAVKENYKIAVVEDNVECCNLIVKLISHKYKVVYAYNGLEGYELIKKEMPDLIISDIMMPEMDGIALCGKIKNSNLLNHIYLILLSAKSEAGDQIQGFEKGADMYISKPFNVEYLLAVVDAHFVRRKNLNNIFGQGKTPALETSEINNEFRKFVEKVEKVLEKEMANEKLNVQFLANEMHMGLSSFHNKFLSVTGSTPNLFIVKYKLNKAVELLNHSNKTVSEISEMLGFKSLSYFSTSFKNEKGISPSEYIKSKRQQ